ncbi:MAG: hypothetical protein AAF215_27930 [Cyanobacteria bacterium P01_A01_bin.123]
MPEIQQVYSRSVQILHQFNRQSGDKIKTIYQPGVLTPFDQTHSLRFYGFITELKCKIDIKSLAESELPNVDVNTSRTDRVAAVRDLEWKSERKQLDLFLATTDSGGWIQIASLSLLNRLPFYIVNLLAYLSSNIAFQVASNAKLGLAITDVGYGLLDGNDTVTIFGAAKEEITTLPSHSPVITTAQNYAVPVGTQSATALTLNPHRKQATFVNRSNTETVWLSYAPMAELGKGLELRPRGGAYEINNSNPYQGAVSAIASGNAELSIMEAV